MLAMIMIVCVSFKKIIQLYLMLQLDIFKGIIIWNINIISTFFEKCLIYLSSDYPLKVLDLSIL